MQIIEVIIYFLIWNYKIIFYANFMQMAICIYMYRNNHLIKSTLNMLLDFLEVNNTQT